MANHSRDILDRVPPLDIPPVPEVEWTAFAFGATVGAHHLVEVRRSLANRRAEIWIWTVSYQPRPDVWPEIVASGQAETCSRAMADALVAARVAQGDWA